MCAGSHWLRMDIPQTSQGIDYDIRSPTPNSTYTVGSTLVSSNKVHELEMQKLIKRLIPYSLSLQGSISYIAFERAKLMAMISSPIINK